MASSRFLLVLRVTLSVVALAAGVFLVWQPWTLWRGGPDVILISIDTCRADYLGCYDPAKPLTPQIDAFSQEATLFERAVSPIPLTLPSHTSMLTGKIPLALGAHENGVVIDAGHETLAEILSQAGYATGAVVSGVVLDSRFGMDQGFAHYVDEILVNGRPASERRGGETADLAVSWLTQGAASGKPLFLLCHFFDPHEPYEPPAPFAERWADDLYAGEVAYADQCVGRVLDQLKALGRYDSSLVIITADHGEMLGEHGELDHGYFIYESALRVPLLIKLPGQSEPRRVGDIAGLIDITPTVCAQLGLDAPADIQGRDLSG